MSRNLLESLARIAIGAAALLLLAPSGFSCVSCKEAVVSEVGILGLVFTRRIYFLLSVVFFVVPTIFGLFLWTSYRADRRRRERGGGDFVPRCGARRW